jgi:hypothetical protein
MPDEGPRAASLGMYDEPEYAAVVDAMWSQIAARLRARGVRGVPARLTRDRPPAALWEDPHLLLAQCCGWPLTTRLAGRVAVVGAPCHDLPGCDGPTHRAFVVVRAADPAAAPADLRGRAFALNDRESNTGMNLPRALFAPFARDGRFFGRVMETGAHRASLAAVASGAADACAVDCVTFGLLRRHAPASVAGLRVLAETAPSPALPFITRAAAPAAEIAALRVALARPVPGLALTGIAVLAPAAYATLATLAGAAAARGYAVLQ